MKDSIISILKPFVPDGTPVDVSVPEQGSFGHYSTNVAMRLANAEKKAPLVVADDLAGKIMKSAPADFFEKVEAVAPGFVNFWLSKKTIQEELQKASRNEHYGASETMRGKTVMVEFTDPNPFKLLHIGHLMSNTIGESISRLYETSGANVIRANYQGDVGLHVAKAIWGMEQTSKENMPGEEDSLAAKMEFLGKAYALGSSAYENQPETKAAIIEINEKIYARSDSRINELYDAGRAWSLAYFETVYKRLGTKFNHYFFESEAGKDGLEVVHSHLEIFKESDGAIVFQGEQYGLHTRVFINSKGLPTYEAKELGLAKIKYGIYPYTNSIVITGNEVDDYFKVLLEVMEQVFPDLAEKTKHISHGMLRLPSGKMSSRTGDVITAEYLLELVSKKVVEKIKETNRGSMSEDFVNQVVVSALKYSILKNTIGGDIIFDFDKSISFEGDSGPYLQYSYARAKSILEKAKNENIDLATEPPSDWKTTEVEKMLYRFPEIVLRSAQEFAPHYIPNYLIELARAYNSFYGNTQIIDKNDPTSSYKVALTEAFSIVIKNGLKLLGIEAPEKM